MARKIKDSSVIQPIVGPIDCACVIHGDVYSWDYVERLYSMLKRHITPGIRFHVYTEADRPVPDYMIKHVLDDWGFSGPKKGWWYKMQLFNTDHHAGALLYFDLDVVVTKNIDWIWHHPLRYFWSIRDFKYLWRPTDYGINSSIMWWDTVKYQHVWQDFTKNVNRTVNQFPGDQDYISYTITEPERKYFDSNRVKSWRWQCLDGGYDFTHKIYKKPGHGTIVENDASILVFHGNPKPAQLEDTVIQRHWR
jgi:hypothetical protein